MSADILFCVFFFRHGCRFRVAKLYHLSCARSLFPAKPSPPPHLSPLRWSSCRSAHLTCGRCIQQVSFSRHLGLSLSLCVGCSDSALCTLDRCTAAKCQLKRHEPLGSQTLKHTSAVDCGHVLRLPSSLLKAFLIIPSGGRGGGG